ncbi:MAG: zinc-ribbon domain-containing protein [Bacteroidales bacterium]|nr:zinc-ribbon domain-containing protein [Bacteroidales bacterium]
MENCPRCGAPLKPNAKFCTKCGLKLTEQQAPDSQNNPTTQSTPITQNTPSAPTEDVAVTDTQRIYWNIQPGQVARVISQAELEKYSKVRGVMITEGTTAYIRANGMTVASISGGIYDLVDVDHKPVQEAIQNATESVSNAASGAWNFVMNLFRKKSEGASKAEPTELERRQKEQDSLRQLARGGASFEIIILVDKGFPLLVGAKQAQLDDYKTFKPMEIQTLHLKMKMGLNAYFRITQPEVFIRHFLTSTKVLNTAQILDEICDPIRVALQEALADKEWEGTQIPDALRRSLKDVLNQLDLFGLSILRIVEISSSNEDLERFNQLSREMYLSEKELDYLRRTNDFKNRLADVSNAQRLTEARTQAELDKQLDEINRDNLLRADEMEALKAQLTTNAQQREQALRMMRLKDDEEYERIRTQGQLDRQRAVAEQQLELERKKQELELERLRREEELKAQKRKQQFEMFQQMTAAQHQHEEELERMRTQNNAEHEREKAEREKEFAERMREQQQTSNDQMFQLLQTMIQSNGTAPAAPNKNPNGNNSQQ